MIPQDYEGFKAWREKQVFSDPALAKHAELVERDMEILKELTEDFNPTTRALCLKNIADFMAKMRG